MKTKLALLLVFAALTVSAQTNSVHTWTLKSGAVFTGDYFASGTAMVVIKSHGTNCLLKISDLSTNDWLYFQECKAAQRQRQFEAEAKQMHNWTLKTGEKFTGDYFTSGTEMVVIKSFGTNCLLKISDLSTKDWLYFYECRAAQWQRQLDDEAAQMRAAGKMEFTVEQIENFPEKVVTRYGWIDAYFLSLDNILVKSKEDELGFEIRDKDGNTYSKCRAIKYNPYDGTTDPVISEITDLKRGDKVRFIGMGMPDVHNDNMNKLTGIYISEIEMIESAAAAAAYKQVKRDLGN